MSVIHMFSPDFTVYYVFFFLPLHCICVPYYALPYIFICQRKHHQSSVPSLTRRSTPPPAASSERPAVHASPVTAPPPPAAASAPSGAVPKWSTVQAGPVLEEWQLPARYRRLPMEEREIECINVSRRWGQHRCVSYCAAQTQAEAL